MSLLHRRHWVFDMDGTLTVAVHDFESFKRAHGLPSNRPVLEGVLALPPSRATEVSAALETWEQSLAAGARASDDALALLDELASRGHRMAVLTRNTREIAWTTLRAAGIDHHFDAAVVLGRDDARPKPHPEGVLRILGAWGAAPTDAVMVGDYIFDVQAGKAAGTATVLVDRGAGFPMPTEADWIVDSLLELMEPS